MIAKQEFSINQDVYTVQPFIDSLEHANQPTKYLGNSLYLIVVVKNCVVMHILYLRRTTTTSIKANGHYGKLTENFWNNTQQLEKQDSDKNLFSWSFKLVWSYNIKFKVCTLTVRMSLYKSGHALLTRGWYNMWYDNDMYNKLTNFKYIAYFYRRDTNYKLDNI